MNFRPVYQLSFLVVFLLLVIAYYRKNTGKLLLSIVLFISGCAVVLAP
jgi:hypothetical protein